MYNGIRMKNGFAVLGIIVGLVIGAFVVGYVVYEYNKSNPESAPQSTPTEESSTSPQASTSQGSETKYKKLSRVEPVPSDFAFDVEVPISWNVSADLDTADPYLAIGEYAAVRIGRGGRLATFLISQTKNTAKEEWEAACGKEDSSYTRKCSQGTIDGHVAYVRELTATGQDFDVKGVEYFTLYIDHPAVNNRHYYWNFLKKNVLKDYSAEIDHFKDTFKFGTSADDTF